MILLLLLAQLWMSTRDLKRDPPSIHLKGNWQSCRDEEGRYGERIYEHRVNGKFTYEFHMGPLDEFALYRRQTIDEHSHDSKLNILGPAYHITSLNTYRGARQWMVAINARLRLWISVVRAGGSREECESFFVLIEEK